MAEQLTSGVEDYSTTLGNVCLLLLLLLPFNGCICQANLRQPVPPWTPNPPAIPEKDL